MGIKTKEEYIESIRQMKPTAYMFGEKIASVVRALAQGLDCKGLLGVLHSLLLPRAQ